MVVFFAKTYMVKSAFASSSHMTDLMSLNHVVYYVAYLWRWKWNLRGINSNTREVV